MKAANTKNTNAAATAMAATSASTTKVVLRPVRASALSRRFCTKPASMLDAQAQSMRLCRSIYRRQIIAANLSPPSRAEQEADAGGERERRIGPLLERLVDRVDHIVADLAHGADRFHALVLRVGNHALDIRPRALPRLAAPGGQNARDLLRQPRNVIAQCFQIFLNILAAGGCGFAGLLDGVARYVAHVCTGALLRLRVAKGVPGRLTGRARKSSIAHPGSFGSSDGSRCVPITSPTIDSGTARKAPIGPHNQAQNTIAMNTTSGLSVRRWPRLVGVRILPSIVVSATKAAGGSSA